jgi:Cdc6-like AAA superfamily ATPase
VTSAHFSGRALLRLVRRLVLGNRGVDSPHLATPTDSIREDRERLIRRILSTIHNNSILLCGEQGTGKTSILLHLKDRLASAEDPATVFLPVYIDLRGVPENVLFATVGDAVLGQLAFAPPTKVASAGSHYDHRDLAGDFRGVIQTLSESTPKQARLVLLVDGIDELNHFHPRTTQRVRSLFMASLAESLVMVASAVEIDKHWEQEGSPWYNFFEEIEVLPFDREQRKRDRMPRNG